MPVSPQDFELYSRMTGAPMPSDAMSRMQMAPDVYKFTKNFARKPNLLEKTGNLIKSAGRNTLVGAGLLAGMDLDNQERQRQELMRNEADKAEAESVTMENPVEEVASEPLTATEKGEIAKQTTARLNHSNKMEQLATQQQNALDLLAAKVKSVQEPTTADAFGQDRIENQTANNVIDRKMEQGSQIADSTPNVAEVLSETQDSAPVDTSFPVGDARRNMRSVEEIERNLQEDMETVSLTRIGGPEGGVGKNQLAKFLSQKGLDQALLGAIGERMTPEPRIGDSSPLIDHPDLPGGEDDINLPSGTNTSPTTNLEDHYGDMRRMEAQERRKRKSPSDRQINLLEQRAIDNQEAIDSGFMSMSDEERANETARLGGDRIREMAETSPVAIRVTDLKRTGVLSGQLTRFPAGEETEKATERKRLRREKTAKADDFKAKFVEGALSDIVRGARGNKSLGITRIPPTNGDAQVGFVLANKPLDKSPTTATTYGFGVAPGAEGLLDNQLNQESFSDYMQRGLGEAKEGKKRKAGEIFEFLPPSARVVSGTARLGDIVM